jgi:hypothetical protein
LKGRRKELEGPHAGWPTLFYLIPLGFLSDWIGCGKLLIFVPIFGGTLANLGEKNRQN